MNNVNNTIINKYFDCNLLWNNDIPSVKIQLKDVYKQDKSSPLRPNISKKIPYSGIQREYYVHYFGETELADVIHSERKKLSSKHSQLKWWISTNDLDKEIIDKIDKYLFSLSKHISDKLTNHYNSDKGNETREKLRKRSEKWSPIIGKLNSDKWNDDEWVLNEMKRRFDTGMYEKAAEKNRKRMDNPEYFDKFMKAVRNPERIDKISKSVKKMWERMRDTKPIEYYNILNSGPNKNFELNGYRMNYIEFLMGSVLNSLNIEWVYESDFKFGNKVYVPDFYIPDLNIIIECYGDYWHANPMLYEGDSIIFGKILVNDVWEKDVKRNKTFEDNGYTFLSFWESDIKNNINKVKEEIWQSILKKN